MFRHSRLFVVPRAAAIALLSAALAIGCCAVNASAQATAGDDPSRRAAEAAIHLGPLALAPTISLTSVGVDTNVFFEPESSEPQKDFTFTLTPKTEAWLRLGRTWLMGTGEEGFVYYRKYMTERADNHRYSASWRIPFNRLTITPGFVYANVHERPGFEIDARSRRRDLTAFLAGSFRIGAKTELQGRVERLDVDFDKAEVFRGDRLFFELNRTTLTRGVLLRHRLTPLTTIGIDVLRIRDRFEFSPLRDADSTRVAGTIELDPFALIRGKATVGVRDFQPRSATVPAFRGLTALVDLSYVLLGSTKVAVQSGRDVQYSYDVDRPYYVQTGLSGSVTQHLFGPIQAGARIGGQRLAYRNRILAGSAASSVPVAEDPDVVRTYGGSIGYRLGPQATVSFDVDHQRRQSPREGQQYQGLKMGMSVTYGF